MELYVLHAIVVVVYYGPINRVARFGGKTGMFGAAAAAAAICHFVSIKR